MWANQSHSMPKSTTSALHHSKISKRNAAWYSGRSHPSAFRLRQSHQLWMSSLRNSIHLRDALPSMRPTTSVLLFNALPKFMWRWEMIEQPRLNVWINLSACAVNLRAKHGFHDPRKFLGEAFFPTCVYQTLFFCRDISEMYAVHTCQFCTNLPGPSCQQLYRNARLVFWIDRVCRNWLS